MSTTNEQMDVAILRHVTLDSDALNAQAYADVLDCREPTMPESPLYLIHYDRWFNLLPFSEEMKQKQ